MNYAVFVDVLLKNETNKCKYSPRNNSIIPKAGETERPRREIIVFNTRKVKYKALIKVFLKSGEIKAVSRIPDIFFSNNRRINRRSC